MQFCACNIILPLSDDAVVKAADIYAALKKLGELISDGDILVAAIAITNNLVLITNNSNHFSRINGLIIDNWKK
jgi:tRNA(fMet)-specific endonuclease VapC